MENKINIHDKNPLVTTRVFRQEIITTLITFGMPASAQRTNTKHLYANQEIGFPMLRRALR